MELVQRIPLCIQFDAVYETYASSRSLIDRGSHLKVRVVHDVTSGGSERIGEGHWWQSLLFSVSTLPFFEKQFASAYTLCSPS